MAGITLVKEALDPVEVNPYGAWFLRVTATSDEPGLNSKIFVYKAATPGTFYNTGDVFETVASIQQMQDIPEDEATFEEGETTPYYRKNVFEAYFTHPDFLTDAWRIIQEDTNLLLSQHRVAEESLQEETVVIAGGGTPSVFTNTGIPIVYLDNHVEGDTWQGIPVIGPLLINGLSPEFPAARIRLRLARYPFVVGAEITFDSDTGGFTIVDADTWEFTLPPVAYGDFTLIPGTYKGQLEITDTEDTKLTTHEIRMSVIADQTP